MLTMLALVVALAITIGACGEGPPETPSPVATPGATITPTPGATVRVSPLVLSEERLRESLLRSLYEAPDETGDSSIDGFLPPGLDLLRVTQDPQYSAMLVDMLGIPPYGGIYRRYLIDTLEDLTGEDIGTDWFDWIQWVSEHPEIAPPPLYGWWKGELLSTVDPRFREFLPAEGVAHDIRLEEIVWGGVRVDGIPSLDDPEAIEAHEARYLDADEQVFGVTFNGESRAYPLRIMNWHEMTNDVVGGMPFSLAYCTLCGSGILFDTRGEDGEAQYRFGSSGLLYRSNKLMYDAATKSLWNQFTGRPVVGPLVGQDITLPILPVTLTTWGEWNTQHPDTTVLSLNTGHERPYNKPGTPGAAYNDYFASPSLLFPGGPRTGDYVLRPKSQVYVAITPGGETKAYPLDILREKPALNDVIGELPIVVLTDSGGGAQAFPRGDNTFTRADDGALLDNDIVEGRFLSQDVQGVGLGFATVLSLNTGHERPYNKPGTPGAAYNDYFASPSLLFPGGPRTGDYVLRPKSQVYVAITPGGETKAYPLDILREKPALNDVIGELPIVVLTDSGGGAQAFPRGDNTFTRAADGALLDNQNAEWQIAPTGLTGPNGEHFPRLSGHVAFWFGYASFRPDGMVYLGEGE